MKLSESYSLHLFVILFFLSSHFIYPQALYMPLEFQAAYEEGTRSLDGRPGAAYWQNSSDYTINASINIPSRILSGTEDIVYHNNSPDDLDRIVIRLYQNINRPGNRKDFDFEDRFFTGGVMIKSVNINGKEINPKDTSIDYTSTNMIIRHQSIPSGGQARIKISWELEIPAGNFLRMGAYDSTAFFVAYWYPQVAVYDDIFGWDRLEYTGGTEFYNDFNNFDVKITLPNTFGVWAAGELVNASQVLLPYVFSRYTNEHMQGNLINIISNSDYIEHNSFYSTSEKNNTWHFKAEGVPDFTFGLSDHFLWDGKTINDGTKNVFVSAVYDPKSTQFYGVCEVAAKTIEMLSHDLPGLPFPYPKMTIYNGEDGVESPMMVNMSAEGQRIWMVHTTVHEVAHTIFPFYMGINERRFAWMDEGWTQMLSEYMQLALDTTIDFRKRNVKRYLDYAGKNSDMPMMYPSYMLSFGSYGNASYFRPAAAYNILKDVLEGHQSGLFKRALQEFINRWNGKHPSPYDFFYTFENVTNEELDWLWQPWFFEQGYPDLGIDSVNLQNGSIRILINKIGELPIPVSVDVMTSDGSDLRVFKAADVWKSGDSDIWIEEDLGGKTATAVTLGNKYIPDADTTNNMWKVK